MELFSIKHTYRDVLITKNIRPYLHKIFLSLDVKKSISKVFDAIFYTPFAVF